MQVFIMVGVTAAPTPAVLIVMFVYWLCHNNEKWFMVGSKNRSNLSTKASQLENSFYPKGVLTSISV
jgi:hypothetical protein